MSGNEDEEKPKTAITLRTIVTGPEAGSIIGRGGEIVNSIRDESGAKIRIEGSSPQERIITVDGPTDSIFKAYTLICKNLEGRERRDSRDGRDRSRDREEGLNLNLLVLSSQCGAIIGKEGCKIKEIRETTGAAIHVSGEPLPGSNERSVKVSGSREEVTQCIYHICCALLECPPKSEAKLYKPDGGWGGGDGRSNYGGSGNSRGRDRDSYRRERSPPPSFSGDYSSSFEAIADFARRQRGGGRGRDDSRDRDQRYELSVPNDIVGAVIGKRGSKINEIRQISGATINIMESGQRKRERSPDNDRERIIEIMGSTTAVALAKSLINMAMDMGQDLDRGGGRRDRDDRRGGGGRFARTRSRSRDRGNGSGYDDRRGRRDKFAPY